MSIQVPYATMKNKELNKLKTRKSISKGVLLLKLILLLLFTSLIFYLLYPVDILKARDFKTEEILGKWILKEKIFTVAYTHSVMLSEVTETYGIQDGKIILLESSFKDFGAGLPATTPYDFEIDEERGVFRIFNINEEIKPLIYRTGAERANHRLIVDDKEYEFLSFSQPREGVEFTSEREGRLKYILN